MACPRPPKKPIHPTEVVFGEDNKKWRDEKLCEEPRSSVFGKRGRQFDIRGEVYVQKDVIELSMAKGWSLRFSGNTENGDTDKRWIKKNFCRQNQWGETTMIMQGGNYQGVWEVKGGGSRPSDERGEFMKEATRLRNRTERIAPVVFSTASRDGLVDGQCSERNQTETTKNKDNCWLRRDRHDHSNRDDHDMIIETGDNSSNSNFLITLISWAPKISEED